MDYIIWAVLVGAISAFSLPLGSWIGLRYNFSPKTISFMAAFGAGALLAALSIELIAPTVMDLHSGGDESRTAFFVLIAGCLGGSVLYIFLDKAVNSQGGFFRRTSSLLNYYQKSEMEKQEKVLDIISNIELFRNFPTENIDDLLGRIHTKSYKKGAEIMEPGSKPHELIIIIEGEFKAYLEDSEIDRKYTKDAILNLVAMVTGDLQLARASATTRCEALIIKKPDFDKLRKEYPKFDEACRQILKRKIEEVHELYEEKNQEVIKWTEEATEAMQVEMGLPPVPFIREAKKEHSSSPLAIWLGILLDGIPESMVIGAGVFGIIAGTQAQDLESLTFSRVIPFTLIAGLFLSNFPEALSSSSNMLKAGLSKSRILWLWTSLMIITAIGAGVGYELAGNLSHTVVIGLEGLAAGAMLTMIAAAMIPEAVILGTGNLVGFSTLIGFLSAILFKLLE